jgi:predicted ATPase/transcriptional regulator with XRE-family HTH domain/Tfp pilus assembly protein PilF
MESHAGVDMPKRELRRNAALPSAFGDLLQHYRRAARLTQRELAERAQVNRDTIRSLERGLSRAPRQETLALLIAALDLAPDEQAQLEAAARQQRFTSPPTPPAAMPLPVPLTPLVGRGQEIASIMQMLEQDAVRLLTLTGPAGVGKTRLSVHIASALAAKTGTQVAFVALAPVHDPEQVLPTIVQTLGVTERQNQSMQDLLVAFLRDHTWLLVLDNFEQVIAAAPEVATLVSACPLLTMLITSRAPLRVRGEQILPVAPLPYPDNSHTSMPEDMKQYPALTLFAQRARAVKPDVVLSAPIIAAICRRLDGLPLAIELAAARVTLLSPPDLLAHLEGGLAVLSRGARDLPDRHQTMRAAIDWSYHLLEESQQRLFRALSVFAGGCTLDSITAVCPSESDLIDELASLIEQSLVSPCETRHGAMRVRLLVTMRDYGQEQAQALGEWETLRQRHAAYYLALAEQATPLLQGPEQTIWLARLEEDFDNLRAALHWAQDHEDPIYGLQLVTALWRFWHSLGHVREGRRWLDAFLAQPAPSGETYPAALYAKAYRFAGRFAYIQGEYERAVLLFEQGLAEYERLEDASGKASVLGELATVAERQGDMSRAVTLYTESLNLHRALGQTGNAAMMLNNLSNVKFTQGDYQQALTLSEESLALFRGRGDGMNVALVLTNIGWICLEWGDYAGAAARFAEGLAMARAIEHQPDIINALLGQADLAYDQAAYPQARALAEECLQHSREVGDVLDIIQTLDLLARVALAQGQEAAAAQWANESRLLAEAQNARDALARTRLTGAEIALAQGDATGAASAFCETLRQMVIGGIWCETARGLEGLAEALCALGHADDATQVLGAASALRKKLRTPLPPRASESNERCLAAVRTQLGEEAMQQAWQMGSVMSVEDVVMRLSDLLCRRQV